MRHRKAHRALGRDIDSRKSLLRNLTTSLIENGKVETTLAKAKELRSVVEKMITMAGDDNHNNRKRAAKYIYKKDVVKKLFVEVGPKYKERPGGYTRIYKLGERRGDNAMMSIIELV
ncbi:MAG: 50S ribosomal protein L17 [Candidatus Muiribacterium halophilum]|uniref:Large ribosomal subunit protein bL17 n=1 Tax=Muiribacterium halophilum TaxID=2053465 RepID=A0A2N5ZJG3_MUIH1|nr:MAG: 50S ribosomal protein L17 [Candidatus Muirbacterium halophilum]